MPTYVASPDHGSREKAACGRGCVGAGEVGYSSSVIEPHPLYDKITAWFDLFLQYYIIFRKVLTLFGLFYRFIDNRGHC